MAKVNNRTTQSPYKGKDMSSNPSNSGGDGTELSVANQLKTVLQDPRSAGDLFLTAQRLHDDVRGLHPNPERLNDARIFLSLAGAALAQAQEVVAEPPGQEETPPASSAFTPEQLQRMADCSKAQAIAALDPNNPEHQQAHYMHLAFLNGFGPE